MVYFIQAVHGGPIKIGITAGDPVQRIREISRMSPYRLHALLTIPGDIRLEAELHKRFATLRQHGEWFSPAPELLDYIYEQRGDTADCAHPQRHRAQWLPHPVTRRPVCQTCHPIPQSLFAL